MMLKPRGADYNAAYLDDFACYADYMMNLKLDESDYIEETNENIDGYIDPSDVERYYGTNKA